ncbi:dihydroflavonol-4-reductase [Agromyces flavus]|uniref:Dihydroflavonol-4-reductase n=1 Tax=Agromyces flavus TaxID=589382 RepID=A0A1H1ZZ03_9MICO|nr:NAD-dependent epimerase/dehydratase family protein [Agromyces flavus]MCP2367326.1 dihydroflavonol-4-reductase [Agromyces flavus]GGI45950.1 dihydroflavonol-4-reductase [Agromyces flavus]SDT38476.1 dihydroflavonol-4-reductase [Agromyces flavus]
MSDELILVTGGTGFIGVNCIIRLLADGARVRTTVRDLRRTDDLRALVRLGGADPSDVDVVGADLLDDAGWPDAVRDVTHVLHVASPFPTRQPRDEDELIRPAREGTLRVLHAARDAGVRRVVQTSSFAAVGYGPHPGHRFTEADWTDPDRAGVGAYARSKTLAERAAWDFIAREGGGLELAVVNPGGVFGPAIGPDLSSSLALLLMLLDGRVPALPRASFNAVDVRDVADLHLRAMRHPDAAGERFIAVSGDALTYPELAAVLRDELGEAARRVTKRTLPDWVVRVGAPFNADLRSLAPELGRRKDASHEKATRVLGWTPRPREEAVLASARSLIELGLVRP